MSQALDRLLRPRSIAVFGGGWAENVVTQCRTLGFAGAVWPVHPNRAEMGGVPCARSIDDLPAAPDAAFVGVNRHATVEVIAALAEIGAGGAICFASGWSETGAADLQADLVAAAGAMPFLGPNCYGVLNYLDGAGIWPDQHGGARVATGVAIITQSSNIGITLTMQTRGLPVAYVAALGNAAKVGLATLAAALLDDPRVTALGLYIEGIGDAPAVAGLAETARAAGKGLVCLKAGKSAAGAAAAASHTASLVGAGQTSSAYLRQAGIAEVATLAELVETLKILHVHGPLEVRRLCSLSCSGGEAAMVADLAVASPLTFPPPSPDQVEQISAVLGPLVRVSNPLDYQTFIWGEIGPTERVFTDMLAGYDAGIFVIDPPRPDRCDPESFRPALDAVGAAARATGKPAFPVASLPESLGETLSTALMADGVVPLLGLETALAAISAASTPPMRAGWRPWAPRPVGAERLFTEAEAKAVLAGAGIAVPRGEVAESLSAAAEVAEALTPPLALKGLGFAHKTEAGAVRLGLATLAGQAEMPGAASYLVEEMVADGVAELLLGLRRDPVYGATLTVGLGGVAAELLADTATLVLPVTADEIHAAIASLRLAPLLQGYRGRPEADVAAAVAAALALQALFARDPALIEIEINPLILRRAGSGAVAVDALIRKDGP